MQDLNYQISNYFLIKFIFARQNHHEIVFTSFHTINCFIICRKDLDYIICYKIISGTGRQRTFLKYFINIYLIF